MQREALAVTPNIVQRHVGSPAKVSFCQMWLDSAYALFEQPFPWPAPHNKPLLLSAFASGPRSTHTPGPRSTHTLTYRKSYQRQQACATADAFCMLQVLV